MYVTYPAKCVPLVNDTLGSRQVQPRSDKLNEFYGIGVRRCAPAWYLTRILDESALPNAVSSP